MRPTSSSFPQTFFWGRLLPCILTIYVLFRISLNLYNDSPWYDEAMQIWISFGCNPDNITKNNGVVEVIKLNQLFNHDPGGFSLLLHLWLKISHDMQWIRLLPLLFFMGSVFVVFLTIQSLFKDKLISFICSLIPFLFDTLLYFSTEIRAYSMECLCYSFAILSICTMHDKKNLGKLHCFSLALCFLMTSRYSAMIGSYLSMFVITLGWLIHNKSKPVVKASFMIVPYVIFTVLIYFFSLSLQNPSVKTPSYVDLSPQIDILHIIIFLTSPCCLFFFARSSDRRLFFVSLYVTLLNFSFLSLALFEIHPADIRSKYCIGLLWGNLVFFVLLLAKLLSSINHHYFSTITLGAVGIGIFLQHNSLSIRAGQDFFDTEKLCKLSGKKIYVDRTLSPTVKYLMTFGEARKWKSSEKNNISFQKQIHHTLGADSQFLESGKLENPEWSGYDVLIVSDPIINENGSIWKKNSNYIYLRN